ncbi:MAG: type II secretion system F family protein [Planctomycetes bacterium]|nr:type II secretion system F family protein [Planctomycetota bacterium]
MAASDPGGEPRSFLAPRASRAHLAAFYRQLATLVGAGVSLRAALRTLEARESSPALRSASLALQTTVDRGGGLAEGMKRSGHVFGELHVALVEAAEKAGRLEQALTTIADHEEAGLALSRRVAAGFAYPFLLLNLALVIPAIPKLVQGGVAAFLVQAGIGLGILYGLLGLFFAAWSASQRSPTLRRVLGLVLWHAPLFSGVVRGQALARFLSVLRAMFASGLPVVQGVALAGRASGSPVLSAAAARVAEDVSRGEGLAESLARTRVLPAMALAIVATGEESGRVEETLGKAADAIEQETRHKLRLVTIALPLAAYIAVACYVGYVIVSGWAKYTESILGQ